MAVKPKTDAGGKARNPMYDFYRSKNVRLLSQQKCTTSIAAKRSRTSAWRRCRALACLVIRHARYAAHRL